MNHVITRDTDVLREFLGVLDEKRRSASPFGRLAATIKLAELGRETDSISIDSSEDDLRLFRKELHDRIDGSLWRRIGSRRIGGRLLTFLLVLLCNQVAMLAVLGIAAAFSGVAATPLSNTPPREDPFFIYAALFLFFSVTPLAATAAVMGGRFFPAWRVTIPTAFLILALSALGTYLVVRGRAHPSKTKSSLEQFAVQRGLTLQSYQSWAEMNWLMKDRKFRQDYERYLRNGPGRWITARFDSASDAGWRDSISVMNDYLDGGQDREGFKQWVKYYLERNRVFSEDRVDQEVAGMTAEVNQRALGIWQLEPLLKERDIRVYSDYLNTAAASSRKWGLAWFGALTVFFLAAFIAGPIIGFMARTLKGNGGGQALSSTGASQAGSRHSFPESDRLTAPSFFDAPYKALANVHRSFLRVSVSACVLVFLFWAFTYSLSLASGRHRVSSQLAFIRGYILFLGSGEDDDGGLTGANEKVEPNAGAAESGKQSKEQLSGLVTDLRSQLDDVDYNTSKKLKEQAGLIANQRSEIGVLKGTASQVQQTTSAITEQIADVNTRSTAADARAGQALGDSTAAKQQADSVEKKVTAKMSDVETKAARASDQAGRATERATILTTRTDALEKEMDRRAREVEARTEELGERTAKLDEDARNLRRLQIVAFTALVAKIKSETDDLDHNTQSMFYRLLRKGEARRDAASLAERVSQLATELRGVDDPDGKQLIEQLEELGKRVGEITARVK